MPHMIPKLEQDVGPPIASPERLTRAKQIVDSLGDDNVPVVRDQPGRKSFWPLWCNHFTRSLTVEFLSGWHLSWPVSRRVAMQPPSAAPFSPYDARGALNSAGAGKGGGHE